LKELDLQSHLSLPDKALMGGAESAHSLILQSLGLLEDWPHPEARGPALSNFININSGFLKGVHYE
jgi:hypothetical protein